MLKLERKAKSYVLVQLLHDGVDVVGVQLCERIERSLESDHCTSPEADMKGTTSAGDLTTAIYHVSITRNTRTLLLREAGVKNSHGILNFGFS